MCAYHCAQLQYTILALSSSDGLLLGWSLTSLFSTNTAISETRTVMTIFPLILQASIRAPMLSTEGKGETGQNHSHNQWYTQYFILGGINLTKF